MLTPEYLQSVGVDIENLFYDAETDILIDIARRIRENDFKMTATAEYQVQKLKELGLATKTINDILAEALNTSNEKIEEIMQESIYKAIRSDMYIYEAAGLDVSGISYKEQILKGTNAAKGEIKNLCKTTAQLGTNKFIELLDKAYLQASSGAFSYDMAISNVINDLAANGLGMIEYPTGTRRRIDTVARTAVRTAVNQSALKCQEDVMDEMDVNLVETSSHLGARPSHAEWQGRIFWRLKPYGNYENFKEATGYGTGAGLGGWNCRHSFYPYFPGLSERTYQHYRKKENEEVYQLEQEQRYNERKIREWKRRQAVNKAGGVDNTREAKKVREWQKRQADFLKKYPDMKRNYARESISNRKVMLGSSAGGKANNAAGILIEKIDMKHVDNYIHKYENEIKDLPVEHSYVLQADGKVFHYTGDKKSVRFDEANLKDAIILHNHPILKDVETNSFENDDFWFLQNYGLVIDKLRATYGNLRYEVKVLKDISSIDYDSYMYGDIGTALMYGEIEGDIHELIFKQLDKEGYIKYVKSKAK